MLLEAFVWQTPPSSPSPPPPPSHTLSRTHIDAPWTEVQLKMLHLLATPAQRQQTCRSQSTCCYRAGTWWCECCRNISPASMASRTRGDTSSCVQISTSLALLLKAELERTARWSFSGGSVDLIGWEIDLIWKFTTACIRLASFPGLQSPNAVIEDLGTRLASAFNKASFPARIKCWDFGNGDKKTITTGSGKYGSLWKYLVPCSIVSILPAAISATDMASVSWEALTRDIREAFSSDHVDVDHMKKLMAAYTSNERDWKRFAKFDPHKYV